SCHMPGPGNVLGAGEGGDIAMAVDHPRLALLLLRVTGQNPRQRHFGCRAALQQAQAVIGQVGIEPGLGSKGSPPDRAWQASLPTDWAAVVAAIPICPVRGHSAAMEKVMGFPVYCYLQM